MTKSTRAPETVQAKLLPDAHLETEYAEVKVEKVHPTSDRADKALVDSMDAFGLLQPVVLEPVKGTADEYRVRAGRRRMDGARRLGWETVRALIVPLGTSDAVLQAITLSENAHRSDNPLADLIAIEALLSEKKHVDEKTIASELGIPLQTVKKRLKLRLLSKPLRKAFESGRMAATVAEAASALDSDRQARLAKKLADDAEARITADDVRAEKQAARNEQTDLLPGSLFDAKDAGETSRWGVVFNSLDAARIAIPKGDADKSGADPEVVRDISERIEDLKKRVAGIMAEEMRAGSGGGVS